MLVQDTAPAVPQQDRDSSEGPPHLCDILRLSLSRLAQAKGAGNNSQQHLLVGDPAKKCHLSKDLSWLGIHTEALPMNGS